MNSTPDARARQGKIARLPYELRETLCRRMRDGWASPRLIAWLAEAAPDLGTVNAQNITNWRKGGYKDWLRDQARLDDIRQRAETTRREMEAGGMTVLDKAIYELCERLSDAELDPVRAAAAIASMKTAVTGAGRLDVYVRRAKLAEETLALARDRFEQDTCARFLEWIKDSFAREIAESSMDNAAKIAALRKHYYADVDAIQNEVELPK